MTQPTGNPQYAPAIQTVWALFAGERRKKITVKWSTEIP
jgi:hypothetical protein